MNKNWEMCFYCGENGYGYPAGPHRDHVCESCRRTIYDRFALCDPWFVKTILCPSCEGAGYGQMQTVNGDWHDERCYDCAGIGIYFKKKSPLILLAECAGGVEELNEIEA